MADTRPAPIDQAHGLRQMFVQHSMRFIPVAANAFVSCSGVLLERLCSSLAELELHTLIVDASDSAVPAHELAHFDLAEGIETLSPAVSYLSAPGLPLQYVDSQGSTRGFLDAIAAAAPYADVVLLHASAAELCRLFGRRETGAAAPSSLILCDDQPESLKQAYANVKLLALRAEMRVHDTLLGIPSAGRRAAEVAGRLAECGETFLGTVQRSWAAVDPQESASAMPSDELLDLARRQCTQAHLHTLTDTAFGALQGSAQALPSRPAF